MTGIDMDSLLVVNRGEIALRIIRACRRLGLRVVCAHSEADRDAAWLRLADQAICVGPAPAAKSYLNIPALMAAAEVTGARLIHPGYGFLSERPEFARAVEAAGRVLVGPSSDVMAMMGDKVQAKRAMLATGVPCVPGPDSVLPDDLANVRRIAAEIGYPIILKAAGGGGGRGMRVVHKDAELADALVVTRQEASRFFGNPGIYIEKFLQKPRHVEIQVLADRHGNTLWLGDRDCSMQRRHQKLIEEAPAPGIDRALIAEIGERCAASCREIGYTGAGTFEFLYEDGQFHFIEMNTRIQVEHPVTEMVTGLDIVAMQIDVARGNALKLTQDQIRCDGHAIECRINAEDPETFAPGPGRITAMHMPGGPGIRVATHAAAGAEIPASYDSMIGKIIAYGPTRAEALARARAALLEAHIEGVPTNIALHRQLLAEPGFSAGGVSIHHLERWLTERRASDGQSQPLDDRQPRRSVSCTLPFRSGPSAAFLGDCRSCRPMGRRAQSRARHDQCHPSSAGRAPDLDRLSRDLTALWNSGIRKEVEGRLLTIDIAYDGPHLAEVAELTGLSIDEVVRLHSAPDYTVYAVGSHAGYCYLGGLNPRLETPRRKVPLPRLPGGSLSVAGLQTGVSASMGPSGWNTIGSTDIRFFDPFRQPAALLAPGDRIRFNPVRVQA